MRLRELGEFGLIERIRKATPSGPGVRLGIGDDAAWVECKKGSLLVTSDLLLEGVHFNLKWTSFYSLGYKALAVNLSDLAAMGGNPAYLTLSLGIPVDFKAEDVEQFYRGMRALASRSGVVLIGGDTSAALRFFISATLVGFAPYGAITRSGARIGDHLYVTGTLGDSTLGLHLLKRRERRAGRHGFSYLLSRHHFPTARLTAGALLAREKLAKAMIDVSDGLLQDLSHICTASGVGAIVYQDALPLSAAYRNWAGRKGPLYALTGGEDYELLFCVRRRDRQRLERFKKRLGVRITRIGECRPIEEGIRVLNSAGEPVAVPVAGHDHFKGKN
ncbi:MAG: thiamine-phosphate kinase [Deltaproteobacteria bacterium]|nr:thiamine-phosphate kinase [Deltaproteobacteria bacterium]